MKSLSSKYKWIKFVYGTLLVVAGILVIIFAITDPNHISKWLSIVTAVTLFCYALALMTTGVIALKKRYFDVGFIFASIFIALGVVFLANEYMIDQFITIFFATVLCCVGGVFVGEASVLLYLRKPKVYIILYYVFGAILLTGGILAFVFRQEIRSATYIITGGLISLVGLVLIVVGMYDLREPQKDKKKEKKRKVIKAKVNDTNKEEDIKQIESKDDNVIDVPTVVKDDK